MSEPDSRKGPARLTWAALFAVIAAALGTGGYEYYRHEAKEIRREKSQAIAAIGELKAREVAQWRRERTADAARLAASPAGRRDLEEWLRAPGTPRPREDWRTRLVLEQRSGGYDDALLVAPDGRVLMTAKDEPDPVDPVSRRAILAALAAGEPRLSDFYRCPHGTIHIDVAAPITDPAGRPLAVLILRSNAEAYLYPLVQAWPTPSRSAETLIVMRAGDEIVYLNETRHRAGTALTLREPLTFTDRPAVQAVLGRRGVFEGTDYRRERVVADLRAIPDSPWSLVAKVDSREILSEARSRAEIIALVVSTFILLTAGMIALAYRERHASLYRNLYRAERDRREAEEIFRTTLYSIGDAVIMTDHDGRVRKMNPVAEQLTGWAEGEAANQPVDKVFRIVTEETHREIENPVQRVLREGQVVGLANHTVLLARDGTERFIADSGAPIRDDSGGVIGVVLVFRDSTAERAAQRALENGQAEQKAVLDNLPVGIAVNSIAPRAAFLYMNDNFPAFYRTTREALADPDRFWDAVYESPEFREEIRARVLEDCASGDPRRMHWADVPITRQGAETTFITAKNILLSEERLVVSTVWDVTDRKRAEEALRQSEEQLRAIFETASVGIAQADPQSGRWLRVNARMCAITGYSREELLEMKVPDITHPDDRQLDWEAFQRVVRGELPDYRLEKRYLRKDGTVAWVNVNMTVLRDALGRPLQTIGVIEDITERSHAEEALRASEERHRKLFDEATEGIVLTDADTGEIIDCNQAFLSLSEYALSDLVGKPQAVLYPEEAGDLAVSRTLPQHRSDKRGEVLETELLTRSGAPKQVEIKANVLDIGGRAVVQAFFRDITAALRYQRERETTLAVMRLLNDPNNTDELLRDLTRLVREWTGCEAVGVRRRDGDEFPYCETHGFPAEFVAMESHLCIRDEIGQPVYDDGGRPQLECMCGNVLSGRFDPGKPFFTAKGSFWTNCTTELLRGTTEADRLGRTRNRCNGEGYESVALFALRHADQMLGLLQVNDRRKNRFTPEKIAFLEGLADQIGLALAQRQAQIALRNSEHFNREVIAGARDGVVVYDRDFRYLLWNPFMEELTGLPASEVLGRRALGLFPHMAANGAEALFQQAAAGRTVQSGEQPFHIPQTGKSGWYSSSYSPHCDQHGTIVGVIGIIRDLTDRKRAEAEKEALEAQLRQAQKMESVGRLAGGVAHDFNNMLNVIVGHSDLALRQTQPSDPLYQDLQVILDAAQRSANLTRQLLAFARKQTIQPKLLDLDDTIGGMLKMLRRLIGEDINLVWQPAGRLRPVMMDPTQLDQILANLAVNARDAIEGVGRITIETRNVEITGESETLFGLATGHHVLLEITDDGCGMDRETLAHLFEPFFTTKPQGQGTGLGLATVYGIVQQNHGSIRVRSERGRGTTFSIYLPGHEWPVLAPAAAPESAAPPAGTETVLLVEDEAALLQLSKRLLTRLGYTVLAAGSPGDALQLADEHRGHIHLLLTDVVMPEVSGLELQQLLALRRPGMRCLFTSGYSADVLACRGVLDHDIHFLQKPFSLQALAQKVREALQ